MKGMKAFHLVAGLVALACVAPAWAEYTSIAHNLQDGTADTTYVGGVLSIGGTSELLDLNDPTNLGVTVTNVIMSMTTNFDSFDPTDQPGFPNGAAFFTGGSFALAFDVTAPAGEVGSYSIGGPIEAFALGVTSASSSGSVLEGSGLFTALAPILPGSNNWPDGGGFSSIDTITLYLNQNLAAFDFNPNSTLTGGETLYTLQPNDSGIPEPASLLLLGFGSLALVRRRTRS